MKDTTPMDWWFKVTPIIKPYKDGVGLYAESKGFEYPILSLSMEEVRQLIIDMTAILTPLPDC